MNLNIYIAIAGILLLLCVFANKISDRFGIPSLLLFLALGMLAGVDGPGGIRYHDSLLTSHVGTIALMFILYNGGLLTNWSMVKKQLFRGTLLAVLGVVLTAVFLFLGAYYLIGLPFEIALLLSVIVSSTDAPAVFASMRSSNTRLSPRLKALLEFESASNDPMAVFLSMGAIAYLTVPNLVFADMWQFFVRQMFIGVLFGLGFGKLAALVLQKTRLPYSGLYPVFGISVVCLTFSLTQLAGGSGFLAVYLTGIIMGNSAFLFRRHLIRFNDSLAWIMQISMFLVLGLLVNPSELGAVVPAALASTLFLMFIARPLAVFICLFRSKFCMDEQLLVSWAGLKGAVPIILATYPLIEKVPHAQYIFNLIFFLVIVSVLFQGKTLPWLAVKLGLEYNNDKDKADEPRCS